MKSIFRFFHPPAHRTQIKDPKLIAFQYKYWRTRIFFAIYSGYVFYYFTRKSFTFAKPALIASLGFDKAQLGLLESVLYITYGISKFVSGIMSDQSNPRYFMAFGLIITGITNIFFGLSSSIWFFAIFWGLNGWFQGWGWPPCARLLTHWYSQEERGTWWSIWSTSHNVGGFLIPIFIGFVLNLTGWRGALLIPGIMCIGMGCLLISRLRDTPQSLGLPSVEKYKNEEIEKIEEKELSTKQILIDHVLKNKWVWLLSIASFFVYIIRMAINDWSALFLIQQKQYTVLKANICVSFFEIGGLFGMLVAGWLSDKMFKGKRGPINTLFSLLMILPILGFAFYQKPYIFVDSVFLFTVGFFLFGPQMMIGLAAAELSHKKAAGTASGFAGWFAYFGAAFAGYPLGKIADLSWRYFSLSLIGCSILTVFLFLPTWNAKPISLKKNNKK